MDKKYNIILADPPWNYNFPATRKEKTKDYKTMSINEIQNLPINKIADDDCLLFIWVTFKNLEEVFKVIKSWGFDYKTCGFVWVKKTKHGKDFFGMGEYTRANPEICLIGRKGKINIQSRSVRQLIYAENEKHSQKPYEIRDRIVQLCGDLPRVELFAREKTDGWDVWGNEVESDFTFNQKMELAEVKKKNTKDCFLGIRVPKEYKDFIKEHDLSASLIITKAIDELKERLTNNQKMAWKLEITKVENGFTVKKFCEELDREQIEVYEEKEMEINSELECMKNLLWDIKEYFGVNHSKHNKVNLNINIEVNK